MNTVDDFDSGDAINEHDDELPTGNVVSVSVNRIASVQPAGEPQPQPQPRQVIEPGSVPNLLDHPDLAACAGRQRSLNTELNTAIAERRQLETRLGGENVDVTQLKAQARARGLDVGESVAMVERLAVVRQNEKELRAALLVVAADVTATRERVGRELGNEFYRDTIRPAEIEAARAWLALASAHCRLIATIDSGKLAGLIGPWAPTFGPMVPADLRDGGTLKAVLAGIVGRGLLDPAEVDAALPQLRNPSELMRPAPKYVPEKMRFNPGDEIWTSREAV